MESLNESPVSKPKEVLKSNNNESIIINSDIIIEGSKLHKSYTRNSVNLEEKTEPNSKRTSGQSSVITPILVKEKSCDIKGSFINKCGEEKNIEYDEKEEL